MGRLWEQPSLWPQTTESNLCKQTFAKTATWRVDSEHRGDPAGRANHRGHARSSGSPDPLPSPPHALHISVHRGRDPPAPCPLWLKDSVGQASGAHGRAGPPPWARGEAVDSGPSSTHTVHRGPVRPLLWRTEHPVPREVTWNREWGLRPLPETVLGDAAGTLKGLALRTYPRCLKATSVEVVGSPPRAAATAPVRGQTASRDGQREGSPVLAGGRLPEVATGAGILPDPPLGYRAQAPQK